MNSHITENLNYYLNLENPEYAVMLTGKWGSGKTFFINQFILENESTYKFIKVSLFGIKNLIDINKIIISKSISFSKNEGLQDAIIKMSIGIADKFGKKINFGLEDIPLENILQKISREKKLVFIFDDLERTNINLKDILGYINYFVETSKLNVILLTNEEEIIDKDGYIKFKEKIIGKSYEINQDFELIADNFFSKSDILKNNIETIKYVYSKAKHYNLRHLKQSAFDFDHLYKLINDEFKKNDEFIKEFIQIFFTLNIEIKSGNLIEEEFKEYDDVSERVLYINLLGNEESNDEILEKNKKLVSLLDKYYYLNELILESQIWQEILFKGKINKEKLNNNIVQSQYFNVNIESWMLLWDFRTLEEKEFSEILNDVLQKFNNNEYEEHEKLLHVFGLLTFLSRSELLTVSEEEIIKRMRQNIENLMSTMSWRMHKYPNQFGNKYSKAYFLEKDAVFIEIERFLKEKSELAFDEGLKAKAKAMIKVFKENSRLEIDQALNQNNSNTPIFASMNYEEFIKVLTEIEHKKISDIHYILKQRYKLNIDKLLIEIDFWKKVSENLLENIDKEENKLKYFLLNSLKIYTIENEIIKKLEESSD